MEKTELIERTKRFAIGVIKMIEFLPRNRSGDAISKQIVRSATSVGANYRGSCRARSIDDFISKIQVVEEEADETCYWLEIIQDSHLLPEETIAPLLKEANELTAIFVASGRTAKQRRTTSKTTPRSPSAS